MAQRDQFKTSIIIISRNERLLSKTIEDVFANAIGEIEVIVVLDGPTEYPLPSKRDNLIYIAKDSPEGIRKGINDAARKATGYYLMKTDGHCMFAKGFDEILKRDCKDNWMVVPRRYGMDPLKPDVWQKQEDFIADYYYLSYPWESPYHQYLSAEYWKTRKDQRENIMIDETLAIHGSVWFIPRRYFLKNIDGLDESQGEYGEQTELVFKMWLSGGRIMVDKYTWYAHMQDPGNRKGYDMNAKRVVYGLNRALNYWGHNQWPKQVYSFEWLIDYFWPLPKPHGHAMREKYLWPENWKDVYRKWLNNKQL